MSRLQQHIIVHEHESLRIDKGDQRITSTELEALSNFHGDKGVPYFTLINNGVKFSEYVGVLRIGNTTIEVLPKADKNENTKYWKEVLIGMLRSVGLFDIHAPSSSSLNLRANSILDLYFELFIKEVEYLINRGLIKKYRIVEGNVTSLKGSLKFSQHISKNIVHQERFFVRYSTYDTVHKLHQILHKTIELIKRINLNSHLISKLSAVALNFPDMPAINVSESLFSDIRYNRKTELYKKSIEIARLLLMNYYPDVSRGQNHVLALMFDMNLLWERFVYASLRKESNSEYSITAQTSKYFWRPNKGINSKLRPDIVINFKNGRTIVLDTKWKNLNGHNPSPDDLRQLYVYHQYYKAEKVALVYPGESLDSSSGYYFDPKENITNIECAVITIPTNQVISVWRKGIYKHISDWMK